MNDPNRKTSFRFGVGLCSAYALLVWALLWNQSLPFPLGTEDQMRVLEALGQAPTSLEAGWVAALVDSGLARLAPSDPYPLLKQFRLAAAVAALLGISVWAWRMKGALFGIWVALLSIGFLPLRIVSATLMPQAVCLAMLVWGGMLSLGKPWSKTGTAEQFGGGILLGGACLAAPWGFLYGASIPLHAVVSKKYRRRLERPFGIGFAVGLLPGFVWLTLMQGDFAPILGVRLETLNWRKAHQFLELATTSFGWGLLFLVIGGIYSMRRSEGGDGGWALDFAWPVIPSLLLGYADPLRSSLAMPGVVLLAALGVQWVGHLFVNRTERQWLSTFMALLVGYSGFFGSMPVIRERQAHSTEVKDLAELLRDQIPPGNAVALFRLTPVAEYVSALDSSKRWKVLQKSDFPSEPSDLAAAFWSGPRVDAVFLWIDRKRIAEDPDGLGKDYWEAVVRSFRPLNVLKRGQVELWQFNGEPQTR